MSIDWNSDVAAIWRPKRGSLRAVKRIDTIGFDELLGIDRQKAEFKANIEQFLRGAVANNILLWGSRGTGKSSLVKAALNNYHAEGLRVIEIDKDDLDDLPEVVDDLRELPQRFLIFCDDLSFDEGETAYKHLKSVLEGSIELPPENVLVCATSNRRHLISEQKTDNVGVEIVAGELHYGDVVEEKLSLADRFGLWLSFYPNSMAQYLTIVDDLFDDLPGYQSGDLPGDSPNDLAIGLLKAAPGGRDALHLAAKQFAMVRASKSGRTAKQFRIQYRPHAGMPR